jgi:drug/metabolite transporter (DMT)-like permease
MGFGLAFGVALLLEYLATILVVGWMWIRHGHKPRRLTGAGSAVAIVGLVFVLDPMGGARLDPVGVLWGLAAAVGLATYLVLSSRVDNALPPVAMASAGMTVGAVALLGLGAVGILPMHASFGEVDFVGPRVSFCGAVCLVDARRAADRHTAGRRRADHARHRAGPHRRDASRWSGSGRGFRRASRDRH